MASLGEKMANKLCSTTQQCLSSATGMSWYTPSTYAKCMAVFDDADQLDANFDKWYPKALAIEQDLQRNGQRVIRVFIDPERFSSWCANHGFTRIDKHARLMHANQQVADVLLAEQKVKKQGRFAKLVDGGPSPN